MIRSGAVLTGITLLIKGIINYRDKKSKYEQKGIYAKLQIGLAVVCFVLALVI
jgi:hypothetical protein